MAQSKQALRSRIKSVNSTRKITKAMEMIANAKLFKQRNRMEANRMFAARLQETVNEIVARNPYEESVFLRKNTEPSRMTIVFCSDLGLCGSYNQNVLKHARTSVNKADPTIVIGTSLYRAMKEEGFHLYQEGPISSDQMTLSEMEKIVGTGVNMYLQGEVGGVQLVYTEFVNTMTFRPAVDLLLPCELSPDTAKKLTETTETAETLFEPDAATILDKLIPMMVSDVAYADWLESTTSEQGSRRMAMKTATDNADELSNSLLLEYNKARQASITQEITEIVGGSNAV